MGKKIKNESINNPNSEKELEDLFMYEALSDLIQRIDEQNVISFFDRLYKHPLPSIKADRIAFRVKRTLKRLAETTGKSLEKCGYDISI